MGKKSLLTSVIFKPVQSKLRWTKPRLAVVTVTEFPFLYSYACRYYHCFIPFDMDENVNYLQIFDMFPHRQNLDSL